ncbi:MAG: hypothetical protein Unbinned5179contig1000_15 [Prokaryotic dsDNA virus sp.]|nr:MAG: hypothetical protein Unbinned5179contig1000_15 [Prokaryotic dsDNA virus sp.]|tara:strand:+ start:3918 stop:4973 length:1056 start_codon:yes stop_codon:yes gene_type:complete
MANFGTYEGHKILSQGMANAVQTVKDGFNFREQKRQWQDTFDQNKLEQDRQFIQKVREENRRYDLDRDKFEELQEYQDPIIAQNTLDLEEDQSAWDSSQAADEYIRNQMASTEQSLIIDSDGTLLVNPEFEDIVRNYDTITSLEAIMSANPDMTPEDAVRAQTALTDKYKTGFLGVRKQFVGMTEEEINKFFKDNSEFANWYDKFLIDAGNPRGSQSFGEHMVSGEPDGDDEDLFSISGYGEKKHKTVYNDKDGWGGGIEFMGPSAPSDTQKGNANILLEAIKDSKNYDDSFDASDTIWVTQEGDSFHIEENDFWGNESWEGRIQDGVAQILVNDKWVNLSTFDDWEGYGY